MKFIFILYSYSWRIAPVLTSTAPIAYVVHSWISTFLLSKMPISIVIIIIFSPQLAPIAITISKSFQSYSALLLPPTFLFLGSPILLPTYFLYAYEKSWTGGRQIKILKLQEKKNTLLVQLFMNDS